MDMMTHLDGERNGYFTFELFLDMILSKFLFFVNPVEEMREIFSVFDKDGNGMIDVDEFRQVLMKSGEHTLEEVDGYFSMADVNNDGKLEYHELAEMLCDIILKD